MACSSTRSMPWPARSQSTGRSAAVPSRAVCGLSSNTAAARAGEPCGTSKSRTGAVVPCWRGPNAYDGTPSVAGPSPALPVRVQVMISARMASLADSKSSASCTRSMTASACQVPGTISRTPSSSAAALSSSQISGGIRSSENGSRLVCRRRTAGCRSASRRSVAPGLSSSSTSARCQGSWGSGSSSVTAVQPRCAAATRRFSSAAPHPMCRARWSGSPTGSVRSGSPYRQRRRLPERWVNLHGCALCMEGAATASSTSEGTIAVARCSVGIMVFASPVVQKVSRSPVRAIVPGAPGRSHAVDRPGAPAGGRAPPHGCRTARWPTRDTAGTP